MEILLGLFLGFVTRIDMLFDDPSGFIVSLLFDLNTILNFVIREWKFFLPVIVLVRIYYVLKSIAFNFEVSQKLYAELKSKDAKTLVDLARDVRDMKEKFIVRRENGIVLP